MSDAKQASLWGDRYEAQQQLGKKAGRQTWLARDLQTQDLVVVKLLTFSHDFEWDDLKLFEREAATLQGLSHPAIPRYLDYFEFDFDDQAVDSLQNRKGFALVQTYIEAQSLEQHLKAGRSFSELEVEQLAKDLLEILRYLHDRQPPVIHRDIKPSNLLLTNRSGNTPGQVHLVDFGSVQTLAAKESGTITVVGTYGYMPPEQFGGRATPASDFYSLGATLIYLVTGQHPADLPQEDLQIQFESLVRLSPEFTSWLKWLTEPSVGKRPASVQQALEGLEERRSQHKHFTAVEKPLAKPTHSRISLIQKAGALEIALSSRRLVLSGSYSSGSFLVLASLFSILLLGSFGSFSSFAFVLLVLSFLNLFGQAEFALDDQKVVLVRRLWRLKYARPISTKRRYVWKLGLVRGSDRLHLWVGTQKCEFVGTPQEVNWLAYELSQWLKLPIERE